MLQSFCLKIMAVNRLKIFNRAQLFIVNLELITHFFFTFNGVPQQVMDTLINMELDKYVCFIQMYVY